MLVQFVIIYLSRYFTQKEIYYTIAYSLAYKARTQPLWGDIDDTYYGICSNTCMLQNPQRCKFCGSTFHFAAGNKKQVPLLLILGFWHRNMKDTLGMILTKKFIN